MCSTLHNVRVLVSVVILFNICVDKSCECVNVCSFVCLSFWWNIYEIWSHKTARISITITITMSVSIVICITIFMFMYMSASFYTPLQQQHNFFHLYKHPHIPINIWKSNHTYKLIYRLLVKHLKIFWPKTTTKHHILYYIVSLNKSTHIYFRK